MRTIALVLAASLVAGRAVAQSAPAPHAGHEGHVMPAARHSSPAVAGHVVAVETKEYAFEAPDTIAAGLTTIRLTNMGNELHHAWLVRLDGGHTMADVADALKSNGPPPAWVRDVGGPNAVIHGETADAVLMLTPGQYVLLCFVPGADGVPHAMKGMVRPITVVAKKSASKPAALPAVSSTITLTDYGFAFSKPLAAGRQTIRVRNVAEQSHEILLVTLAPGKSPMDVAAWAEHPDGPPPGKPIGGVTGIAKNGEMYFTADLKPGRYGLICFLPDAKDGKPHFAHGMVRDFEVK